MIHYHNTAGFHGQSKYQLANCVREWQLSLYAALLNVSTLHY